MIASIVEYTATDTLKTLSHFMYGTRDMWGYFAEELNKHASPRKKLAAFLRHAAKETESLDYDEWEDVKDMIDGTLNNVRHDMGEAMGNSLMYF